MAKLKYFIPIILFFLIGGFLFLGLGLNPKELPSALVGRELPPFSLPDLKNTNRLVTNKDLHGEVALLNVWATWCPSCRMEHDSLIHITQTTGIPIFGVNYKDNTEEAIRWLNRLGDPYKLNMVDGAGTLGIDLGVYGAPETFVIDSKGMIRYKHVGVVDAMVWQEVLEPLVEKLKNEGRINESL